MKRKKTMKKIAFITLIGFMAFYACGPGNDQAKLERLERQRDALNERIAQLKAELSQESEANPSEEKPTYVRIEEIQPSLFQHFIKVQGTIESDNNILIPAQTSGIVKKIHVDEGDNISQGHLLAELDSVVLESSIEEMKTSLRLATTIYERQQRLWKKNIGSEIEYLQAKNNWESLEKGLNTLLEQLQMTKIVSPIDGRVDDILIKEGEMAVAGVGTIRIVQLSRLKVVAALAENYIARVKKNDEVRIHVPVLGIEFEHTIDAVSQVIDPNNRTFQIEIKVPKNQKTLKPNLLAEVIINDYSNPQALIVPYNIVQETGSEQFLFVASQENSRWRAHKRVVKTGEDYQDQVEVREGLAPGEQVVTLGFQNLADGQPIAFEGGN